MPNAPADGGPLKTLLPVIILLALVGVAVAYFVFFNKTDATPSTAAPTAARPTQPQPEIKMPTMDTMTGDAKTVADTVKAAVEGLPPLLNGITDAASADAALPKLADMKAKLDAAKPLYDKMPPLPKVVTGQFIRGKLEGLKTQATKTLARPGLAEKLKPVQETIDSLEALSQ